jgi:hypothetical protein
MTFLEFSRFFTAKGRNFFWDNNLPKSYIPPIRGYSWLTMTRTYLGPKLSIMRFGYSYFTEHKIFNLWFVKHMLRNCTHINLNHSRCLWWGQWELKTSKYHNFWRFIKLAITASLGEGPSFYFYVESPPSTFIHCLREHSCHSEFNVHSPKIYHWLIHDYGFACS